MVEAMIRQGGWLAWFVVLAAFLGPRDYGLFVVAVSGIAIIERLLSDAAGQALLNLRAPEPAHVSTAFLTLAGLGSAIALLLYAISGASAALVEDARLGELFQSLSLLPLLAALAAVPSTVLRRSRSGGVLVLAAAIGVVGGGSAALMLAMAGGGPWALVAQIVLQRFLEVAVLWIAGGRGIGLRWSATHFAQLAGALDGSALRPVLAEAGRQVPLCLVGLVLGPTAAGLLLLAERLAEAGAALAARLARAAAAGPLRCMAWAAASATVGSALLPTLAPILLELRWWGAVRPAQALIFVALPVAFRHLQRTAALPTGWSGQGLYAVAVQAATAIAATGLAAPYGLRAIAAALVSSASAMCLISVWPVGRARVVDSI